MPNVPYWMTARKTLLADNLKEMVDWLKANPDKATAASTGTASMAQFYGTAFQSATGTKIQPSLSWRRTGA